MDIAKERLHNHHLVGNKFKKTEEVVQWLGAVQAQDYQMAKWALGQRMEKATNALIETAYNDGTILRTHVLRPTWHFVLPEDIRWMLKLSSPQIKILMGHYNRKLELDDALFKKTNSTIVKALKNRNYLTRQELKKVLHDIGITTNVQRLAHIVMWAELDGLICSGPRRGKQFTYALLEERVPNVSPLNRDESLAKLAQKYFMSHGPAQLKDFAWWSGLSMKDSQNALALIKSKLLHETHNGEVYYFVPSQLTINVYRLTAFLLSIYDEYTIAYKDRSDISKVRDVERMIGMGNALTTVIILNGKVAGTWKKTVKKQRLDVALTLFQKWNTKEKEVAMSAVDSYRQFLGIPHASVSLHNPLFR